MYFAIYVLLDHRFIPFYVGSTNNVRRRMKEHRRALGHKPLYEILEEGDGGRFEAEEWWIGYYQRRGYWLRNKSTFIGGVEKHSAETRALISARNKGRVVPLELRKRLSEASKGKHRNWTKEGRSRVEAAQFKPGHAGISEGKRRASIKAHWMSLSAQKKSEILRDVNLKAWASRSNVEKSRIGQKIAKSRAENNSPEKISQDTRKAAKTLWANMTPDYRAEFIRRRRETLRATLARKRVKHENQHPEDQNDPAKEVHDA